MVAHTYPKPVPALDPESTPFWEGCRQHKLLIQRCTDCGHPRFPATSYCAHCQSGRHEWIAASGRGKIFSWIVVRHPVPGDIYAADVPYVVALVDLDEGVRMTGTIVGCTPEAVAANMPVQVGFSDVTPEITLPHFSPIAG